MMQFTRSIKGWPKLVLEAWEVDEYGRNKIGGYGILNIPFKNGTYTLEACCWRPKPSFQEKLIAPTPSSSSETFCWLLNREAACQPKQPAASKFRLV